MWLRFIFIALLVGIEKFSFKNNRNLSKRLCISFLKINKVPSSNMPPGNILYIWSTLLKSEMELLNKKSNRCQQTSTLYFVKYPQEGEVLMEAERLWITEWDNMIFFFHLIHLKRCASRYSSYTFWYTQFRVVECDHLGPSKWLDYGN